jgi:hypothetical protein
MSIYYILKIKFTAIKNTNYESLVLTLLIKYV